MECINLDEVRSNIDLIDMQIIELIAERGMYVKQASKFKKDSHNVKAPQRVEVVIQKVRNLADEYGANPDLVEKMYRELISGFINMELEEFNK